MSSAERTAIPNPVDGLLLYQLDGLAGLYYFKESST